MRLPNGYGSVTKLYGKRRKPYIIKKTTGWTDKGHPIIEIIGYAATRQEGLELLAEYNRNPWDMDAVKITLRELFELWKEKKAPRLGRATRATLCSAYNRHFTELYDMPYRNIKSYHMQATIDTCGRGYSTQGTIKSMWYHLDRFALELDIIERRYSDLLVTAPTPPTTRDRLSDDVISRLWEHVGDDWVDTVLMLIYSGWRISEFLALRREDVNLEMGTMRGGTKTEAGKNRVVPIHPLIRPLVEARLSEGGDYLVTYKGSRCSIDRYRRAWHKLAARLDIPGTPHSCRHTFESLLDDAGANRKCIDMLMGHVSAGTGNRVYNHKTLDDLRAAIALVQKPLN